MMANTERKTHATTTMEYFFAPNFADINEPVYDELADLLETVRASGNYSRTGFGIETHGFIANDVKDVLKNPDLIIPNSMDIKYYKKMGTLYLRIPYVANFMMEKDDGWADEFLQQLARVACKVVIGIVARSVNQVLVHDGIFYDNERGAEYQWTGKPTCEDITVSKFDSNKFKVMGISKTENPSVKYESDGDGFLFEDRQTSNMNWAEHNTITGGFVDDDVMIQAFGASNYYGRI